MSPQRFAAFLLLLGAWSAACNAASTASPSSASSTTGPGSSSSAASGGAGGSDVCRPCVRDTDCAAGSLCGQFAGDSYCAPDCTQGEPCSADRACVPLATVQGEQASLCIPNVGVCGLGGTSSSSAASTSVSSSSAASTGAGGATCGSLVAPTVSSCCSSCKSNPSTCQANGCYGGWWCNTDTCKCQGPPNPASCGGTSTSAVASSSASTGAGGSGGTVGPTGGTLDTLGFAIVGDTRPAVEDDTSAYPTAIITKIWQDVEATSPHPPFAISTGDYQFASTNHGQSGPQLDSYLQARSNYTGTLFPAMGNHECTGATNSNCGSGNADGVTDNYSVFLQKMLAPLGQTKPYYAIQIGSTSGAWTAKFVFIAGNAWDSTQSSWLSSELAKATTYTFVIRHEGRDATTAPGVVPSDAIIGQHPYTILIAGHTHTYEHFASDHEMKVGNGGAPLSSTVNYGYVVARQRSDGAIVFTAYDYGTRATIDTFAVHADGTTAP